VAPFPQVVFSMSWKKPLVCSILNSEELFCEERFSTLLVKTVKKGKYEMANMGSRQSIRTSQQEIGSSSSHHEIDEMRRRRIVGRGFDPARSQVTEAEFRQRRRLDYEDDKS